MQFLPYTNAPRSYLRAPGGCVASFVDVQGDSNLDADTVASFGEEWKTFHRFSEEEIQDIGAEYFDLLKDGESTEGYRALDVGCGSGRWSLYLAGHVASIEAIDPSDAALSASEYLKTKPNVRVTQASVDTIPFPDESFDLVFSLGVLHHIPDTRRALQDVVKKCRRGGRVLVYLYYDLENRGPLYRLLFHASNLVRRVVSALPNGPKQRVCDVLAVTVYLPVIAVARLAKVLLRGEIYKGLPLGYYVDRSWQVIRNDCRDRFGTPLERRFSRKDIEHMMRQSGLDDIRFSDAVPYWKAIGTRR